MSDFDALMKKIADENRKAWAKEPAPKPEQVASTAAFLVKWSRCKPLVRIDPDATFYSKGKLMTKISPKMRDALVAAGFAVSSNPDVRGETLTMLKVKAEKKA